MPACKYHINAVIGLLKLFLFAGLSNVALAVAGPPAINSPGDLTAPGSVLSTLTPTFTWSTVSGATGYGLYIRDLTTNTLVYNNAGGAKTGTSYNLPSGYLLAGHSFRWAMTSFTGSTESAQSGYRYFQTAQANLTPYQPSGWSAPIVVSTTTGNNTDTSSLTPADTLYIDWAVINNGVLPADVVFNSTLYVDGAPVHTWVTNPPLNANFYTFVTDYAIGPLTSGTHTIKIVTDGGGTISESNESDNTYTKTIIVGASPPVIYLPGDASAPGSVLTTLTPAFIWNSVSGASGYGLYIRDLTTNTIVFNNVGGVKTGTSYVLPAGYLAAGHSFRWAMTSFSGGTESAQSGYLYFQTGQANITPTTPSGWSAPIVVSTTAGNNTDSSSLKTTDTLYIDWAAVNNGSLATDVTFYTQLYVDGVLTFTWNTQPSLTVGSYAFVTDYSIGTLAPGTHTIKIVTNSTGSLSESNASDNTYTKTITVNAASLPTVQTSTADSITSTTAVIHGTVVSDGGLSIIDRRFDWGKNQPLDQAVYSGAITVSGSTFYTILTGLTPGTTYNFRAWARNNSTADSGLGPGWSNGGILTFTTAAAGPKANLTPYQPFGWTAPIVVSNTTGSTTDSPSLTTANTLYVDWSVTNNGNASTSASFYTQLYVDNILRCTWGTPYLSQGNYAFVQNYSIGSLAAGTHTIRLVTDSTGAIPETDETDNTYTKTITINTPAGTPPTITQAPQNQSVNAGASASFTVAASGNPQVAYQWRFNGNDIAGATGPVLNLANLTTSQAGTYSVVASNTLGSTSASAQLTVVPTTLTPTIITQPQNQSAAAGDTVTFSVVAGGAAPLSYIWQKNGTGIAGATGTSLTLSHITQADAGSYRVLVTNAAGGPVASNTVTLTVINNGVAPTITVAPQSVSAAAGEHLTFNVQAAGTGPLTFQWLNEYGEILSTSATLQLNFDAHGARGYKVVVSNTAGAVSKSFNITLRKIILIHGTWNNTDYGEKTAEQDEHGLLKALKDEGYTDADILDSNLSSNGRKSINDSVSYIRSQIMQKWNGQTSIDVDIVAHSAGGLAARKFINRANSVETISNPGSPPIPLCRVHSLITLGTPFGGINGCDNLIVDAFVGIISFDMRPEYAYSNSDYAPLVNDGGIFSFGGVHTFFGTQNGINYWGLGGGTPFPLNVEYALADFTEFPLYDGFVNVASAHGHLPAPFDLFPSTEANFQYVWVNHTDLPRGTESVDTINTYILPAIQGKSWPSQNLQATGFHSASVSNAATPAPQTVESKPIALIQDQPQQFILPVDGATGASFQLYSPGTCAFSLQKPDGTLVDSTIADPNVVYAEQVGGDGGTSYSFTIANPDVGNWTLIVTPVTVPGGQSVANLTATVTNTLGITAASETIEYENGAAPFVRTTVSQDGAAVTNASVVVTVSGTGQTSTATLFDDGLHNDGAANDGVYGVQLPAMSAGGVYTLNFKATGLNSNGELYQRIASSFFTIGPATASLNKVYSDSGADTDSDGVLDVLAVSVGVNVITSGDFSVRADLKDASGNLISTVTGAGQNLSTGANTITLYYSGPDILAHGASGPFKVENIRLYADTDSRPVLITTDLAGFLTGNYSLGQFNPAPVMSTQPQNQTVVSGTSVTFSATFTGAAPFTYQWRLNGTDIPNATGATLNLTNVSGTDEGSYTLVVSNASSSATSAAASLTVQESFDQWRARHFTATQLADPAVSGPNADANASKIPNLLKYFLNLDPIANLNDSDTRAAMSNSLETVDGSTYVTLTYRRNAHASNVDIQVQTSTTLQADSWQTVVPDVTESIAPDPVTGDPRTKVKVKLTGQSRMFIRLLITRQ